MTTKDQKLHLCQQITRLSGRRLAQILRALKETQPNALQYVDNQWVFNLETLTDAAIERISQVVRQSDIDPFNGASVSQDQWMCRNCGYSNPHSTLSCEICLTPNPDAPVAHPSRKRPRRASYNTRKHQLAEEDSIDGIFPELSNNPPTRPRRRNRTKSLVEQEIAASAMAELGNAVYRTQDLGLGLLEKDVEGHQRQQPLLDFSGFDGIGVGKAIPTAVGKPPYDSSSRANLDEAVLFSSMAPAGVREQQHATPTYPGIQPTATTTASGNHGAAPAHTDSRPREIIDQCHIRGIEAIKLHIEGVGKRWKCLKCGKLFLNKGLLRVHIRTHTGTKPLQCNICRRSFSDPSNLRAHRKVHEGRKYECTWPGCGRSFSYSTTLREHMLSHTGGYSMVCTICNQGFRSRSNYNKHMRRKHGVKAAGKGSSSRQPATRNGGHSSRGFG